MSYSQDDVIKLIESVQQSAPPDLVAYFPKDYLPPEIEKEFIEKKFYHGVRVVILDSLVNPMVGITEAEDIIKWKIF